MNDREPVFRPKAPEPPKSEPAPEPEAAPETQHERIARESGNSTWR